MVTTVPTGPEEGLKLVMAGDGVTVKLTPLLATDPTLTTTLPVVAPEGTEVTMLVSLQLVETTGMPLKVSELNPLVPPKLDPFIVNDVPTGPDEGLKLVIVGETRKSTELLARPPTVTTTFPVAAPTGTGTTMLVVLQLVGVAPVPLNATVLALWVAPKFAPVIVTGAPTGAEAGLRVVIPGPGVTLNATLLLANPPTVTTTLPVVAPVGTAAPMLVALQLVGVAAIPLNVTVLAPCVAPKLVPTMVTEVPTCPEPGFTNEMFGSVWTRLIVAVADFVGSAFEIAVKLTVGGFGKAEGAV